LAGTSALLLSTVSSARWKSGVTLTADSLLAIVLLGKSSQGRVINTSAKTKNQMESRLLLDIVVGKGASVFQLLSSEDKTLLIRWNSLLILDLGLYIIDGIRRLDIKGDGLTRKGFNENLHGGVILLVNYNGAGD
jgi:hypothetical protein